MLESLVPLLQITLRKLHGLRLREPSRKMLAHRLLGCIVVEERPMEAIGLFNGCCIMSADIVMGGTNKRPSHASSMMMMTLIKISAIQVSRPI